MLDCLRQNINPDEMAGSLFARYEGRHALIGIVEGHRFRVFLRSVHLRNLAGDFQGEIFQEASGSRIDGRFLDPEYKFLSFFNVSNIRVFMAKVSAFWTCSLCAGLWCWWILRGAHADETAVLFLLTPLCLLVLLFAWIALRRRDRGQQFILEELASVVIADSSHARSEQMTSKTDRKSSRAPIRQPQLSKSWSRLNAPGNSRS